MVVFSLAPKAGYSDSLQYSGAQITLPELLADLGTPIDPGPNVQIETELRVYSSYIVHSNEIQGSYRVRHYPLVYHLPHVLVLR